MALHHNDVGAICAILAQPNNRVRVRYGVLGAALRTRVGHPNAFPGHNAQATVTLLKTHFGHPGDPSGRCPVASWVVGENGYPSGYGLPPNASYDPAWTDNSPLYQGVAVFLEWLDTHAPGWDAHLQSTYP